MFNCRFSQTVRYELRVLVGFKQTHRGSQKVYTGPAAKSVFVRKSNELNWFWSPRRYPCSFEPGITLVWRTVRSVLDENAWNYTGLGALAGIYVHSRKDLHWFGEPDEASSSNKLGITMVWDPSQVSMFIWVRNYTGLANRKKYLRRKIWNYNGLEAFAGIDVHLSQALLVWRTVRSIFVEKAWNYTGLGPLAGIRVHLSKDLKWFGEP